MKALLDDSTACGEQALNDAVVNSTEDAMKVLRLALVSLEERCEAVGVPCT